MLFIVTLIKHLRHRTDGGPETEDLLTHVQEVIIVETVIRKVIAHTPQEAIAKFSDSISHEIQDDNVISFTNPEVYTLESMLEVN